MSALPARWRRPPSAVRLLSLFTKEELDAYVANVKAERPEEADYVAGADAAAMSSFARSAVLRSRSANGGARFLASPRRCTARRRVIVFPSTAGIPSFRFNAEQIERECGPRMLGLARSIRSLAAND